MNPSLKHIYEGWTNVWEVVVFVGLQYGSVLTDNLKNGSEVHVIDPWATILMNLPHF